MCGRTACVGRATEKLGGVPAREVYGKCVCMCVCEGVCACDAQTLPTHVRSVWKETASVLPNGGYFSRTVPQTQPRVARKLNASTIKLVQSQLTQFTSAVQSVGGVTPTVAAALFSA
eukprot:364219-Chlamydomonas_euryale.AAC.7